MSNPSTGRRDTSTILVAQVCVLLVGLVTQSLLAWLLGPSDRGAFAVVFLFGTTAGVFLSIGIDRAAQFCVMSGSTTISEALSMALLVVVLTSMVAIGIGLFGVANEWSIFGQASAEAFSYGMWLVPASSCAILVQLQVAGQRRFRSLGAILAGQSLLNLLLVYVLVVKFELGVNGALLANIIALTFAFGTFLVELVVKCGFRLQWPRLRILVRLLHYGVRYYPARIGHMLDVKLGIILLSIYGISHEIGMYAAVAAVLLRLSVISESIETALLPRIAAQPEDVRGLVESCARISALLMLGIALAIFALDDLIIRIVFSPEFYPAKFLLSIIAVGMVFQSTSHILAAYVRATNHPGLFSAAVWIGIGANYLVFISLYESNGLLAAGYATLAGFLVRFLFLLGAYGVLSERNVGRLFSPTGQDWQMLTGAFSAFNKLFGRIGNGSSSK